MLSPNIQLKDKSIAVMLKWCLSIPADKRYNEVILRSGNIIVVCRLAALIACIVL